MATAKQVREAARAICRAATGDYCMDESGKAKCTAKNCEIVPIADLAVKLASFTYRRLIPKRR